MTLHDLASAAFFTALFFACWAIYQTVRLNWTSIKEAFRGKR